MADTKVTELAADTGPTLDDLLLTVNAPGTTPASKKVTIEDVLKAIHSLTAHSGNIDADDEVWLYDTSAAAPRVTSVDRLKRIVYVQVECFSWRDSEACEAGDGKGYIPIPSELDGWVLVECVADVRTAGTTGTMDIQIHNVTDAVDMLSTKLTVDSAETSSRTAATPAVINAVYDDVAAGDILRCDYDAIHTTPARGCIVTLGFRKP